MIIFQILNVAANLDNFIQVRYEHLLDRWTKDQSVEMTVLYGVECSRTLLKGSFKPVLQVVLIEHDVSPDKRIKTQK